MTDKKSIKCPYCFHTVPVHWDSLYTRKFDDSPIEVGIHHVSGTAAKLTGILIEVDWMYCYNADCDQVIVRIRKGRFDISTNVPYPESVDEWLAVPRKRVPRPIDDLVPEPFRKRYIQASTILDDAPEMSGLWSRRILADLLKKYANLPQRDLATQIDDFIKDAGHPSRLRNNLHYLREIGNFAAHTQSDADGNEIEIAAGEAEWTLDVIDDLFDYFIVGPERDRLRRAAVDGKIAKAGRKPICKPSEPAK